MTEQELIRFAESSAVHLREQAGYARETADKVLAKAEAVIEHYRQMIDTADAAAGKAEAAAREAEAEVEARKPAPAPSEADESGSTAGGQAAAFDAGVQIQEGS